MDRLKAKRAARRAPATKISTEATPLIESGCSDRLAQRKVLDNLMATRENQCKIDAQIEDAVPVEELEREYASAALYNDKTLEALTRLTEQLEELSVRGTTQPGPSAAINTPQAPAMVPSQISRPRLPMLTIQPFHGELEGDAAAAIAGLPTTQACYESAIQQLQDRFGDKRRIVQRHLRMLRRLHHVPSASDTRELRSLYDGVQLNIRCLNVFDVPTSSFSAMLYDILLDLLPEEIVVAFRGHLHEKSTATASSSGDANVTTCH
ncbi:uncharacterized protein LOC144163744 [Haemaphysalis longicornis]